jgi:hypothetical protein
MYGWFDLQPADCGLDIKRKRCKTSFGILAAMEAVED